MSKNELSVSNLPELIEEGKITQKEAVNVIAEVLYKNPESLLVTNISEDEKSSLIFSFIRDGWFVFDHYRKEFGSFMTYLKSYLRYKRMTLSRNAFYENISKQTASAFSALEHEEHLEKYKNEEFSYKIMHFTPYEADRTERVPFVSRRYRLEKQTVADSAQKQPDASYFGEKHTKEEKLVIVLALKSCFFLTNRQIKKISSFCRISEEQLASAIEKLRAASEKKHDIYKSLIEKRNAEYFIHRKCRELLITNRFSQFSNQTERLTRQYDFHTKKWRKLNEKLKEQSRKTCPTNKSIAAILGICERQVGYYLKNIERHEQLLRFFSPEEDKSR